MSYTKFRRAPVSALAVRARAIRALTVVGITLAATALAACGTPETPGDDAIVVSDPAGRTVSLDEPAGRVVSMIPAVTEWVIVMGAADRLVARTDFDHHPAIDTLPSVGGGLTPSIEWLAARRPDLVISWPDAPSRSIVGRLEGVGITVYTAPIESIDDAMAVAADIGTLLGEREAAERTTSRVRASLDSVRASVAHRDPPSVLYLIGMEPLMAAGPDTFVDELIRAAGGRNVLHDLGTRWPQLSLEEVVRREPDILIVGSVRAEDPATLLASRPGWRDVPAVRNGAVHAVDPDVMNRPGPRLADAAAHLATLFHEPSDTADTADTADTGDTGQPAVRP